MIDIFHKVSRRRLSTIFIAIVMIMGLALSSMALAQEDPPVGNIIVNSASDEEKNNDGKCTLREAVIAANKDRRSGGKSGECAAGNPDGPNGQGDIILLQVPDTDPTTRADTDIFTLTRTDNGSEDSSTTGDLDIKSNITIISNSPGPIIIEGGPGFSDRIFHILSGSLTLDQVTIRGGSAKFLGGGFYVAGGELNLSNSTLTANSAGTSGGALYNAATATLTHVTVTGNSAPTGTGLAASSSGLTVRNTVIAGDSCSGALTGAGANLTFNAGGCSAVSTVSGDPLLTAVPFGGQNAYFVPAKTSPAVDAADPAFCPPTDQISLTRPQYAACDIGAVELENVNDPPIASDDTASTNEDTAVNIAVQSNDNAGLDDNDQNLTTTSVTVPAHGSAAIETNGTVTYTPAADFNGSDTFSYEVCDSGGLCDTAAVSVTISPDNDPPTAGNDSAATDEDTAVTVDVQDNDSAGPANENQALTTTSATDGSDGTAVINANGTITYTPAADFYGSDSFTYEICDSGSSCATATVTITVDPVNDVPTADNDSATTAEDISVTIDVAANDSDVEGGLVSSTVAVISGPSHGTAVEVGDGTVVYTPDAHYDGGDSFDYEICDTDGDCSTASVAVTITPDAYIEVTNVCDTGAGSLREAINAANSSSGVDSIVFDIIDESCGTATINLLTELPPLTEPVVIDGLAVDSDPLNKPGGSFTPPSNAAYITLDGGGLDFSGITISSSAGGSTIANLIINNFGGSGVLIGDAGAPSTGNTIQSNTISNNGGSSTPVTSTAGVTLNDGITVFGVNNQILDNNIFANENLNVDLEGDGATPNDPDDNDTGANNVQNYPWLLSATPEGEINGYLDSLPDGNFTLEFFVSLTCDGDESFPLNVSPSQFTTDSDGNILFSTTVQAPDSLNYGQYVISTATDSQGNTSEYSNCIPVDDDNTVWPNALEINSGDTISQPLIQLGQSRWYKFWVSPNSKVKISLDDLPANYDLVYFGNIGQAYAELIGNAAPDLNRLDAEFSTDAFAPAVFNPAVFNPAVFNPAVFNPAVFNPAVFNPAVFNPAVFNPAIFSADVYSPAVFNPAVFNPAVFNPAVFNPAVFNPAVFNGNAYSAAQMSSLITASGEDGTAPEEISINSYNSNGWFYARVRGYQGAFDPNVEFTLGLTIENGICAGIQEDFGYPAPSAAANNYETIILTDWGRMGLGDPNDLGSDASILSAKLDQLAAAVSGVVVDVGADPEVAARNDQADQFDNVTEVGYRLCPYAKNVAADGIKEIVDAYRSSNPIKYVVVVGSDDVIPFYRIPDQALLGPEEDYVVPVDANSASEASLRNNYFLSQDGYGSKLGLAVKTETLPLADVAVGRLIETDDQIINMIDTYLGNPVLAPQKALVTAYDFLTDGGIDVRDDLAASLGAANVNDDLLVANPETWTATDLDNTINGFDFDLAFLSGHFSATGALAADYETGYFTSDFLASSQDWSGALLYSAGCHSGYNIVDGHAIPGYTPNNVTDPDWAAAMAQKGITFIGGTGYQYGDTDFAEYSERLYHEFTRQLRSDESVNIAVGDALVRAKQQYLMDTPKLSGIHQKAVLEATLFGLPMAGVNMPGARLDLSTGAGTLTAADLTAVDNPAVIGDAGEVFGLQAYDLVRNYALAEVAKPFSSVEDENVSVDVSYLENGPGGFTSSAGEPTLPLDTFDATVTDASNLVLRSVGFLGGDYRDFSGKFPLVGAPTTELSAVHFSFLSFVFYPQQPWGINRIDSLAQAGGSTLLNILPAQYRTEQAVAEQPQATERRFDNMELRLFYLADDFNAGLNTGANRPDLAAAPTIVTVSGDPVANGSGFDVEFEVLVVGDPSAGVQDVWITYTDSSNPSIGGSSGSWQSLFLSQDAADSRYWRATLSGISNPQDLRFIAQAVSGTGLVTMSNNLGRFYIPGVTGEPTALVELSGPTPRQGAVGTTVQFSASLTAGGVGLPNLPVLFGIGQDIRLGWTGTSGANLGVATVDIPLLGTSPGDYEVTITFPGTTAYAQSSAETAPFSVISQDTMVTLDPATVNVESLQADVPLFATLTDAAGRPLAEKTVTFTVQDGALVILQKAVITDPLGRARLGRINFPAATQYLVSASFAGTGSYNPSQTSVSSTIKFNRPPICDNVFAQTLNGKDTLWPANNKMNGIVLSGATDPDGDTLTYRFLEIYQDEMVVGDLDGSITNSCTDAEVRAERDGNGDGRVYHLFFEVDDGNGGTCSGETTIATIPHDQGGIAAIDGGPLYNSLGDGVPACTP